MLVKTIDLVRQAARANVAVGAFNTYNLDLTQAIISAAEQSQQPVIVQLGVQPIKVYGEALVAATVAAARAARTPVALHLDHCSELAMIEQCFKWGLSSALADGSRLPFAENLAFTRQAVLLAKQYNASIEAELGYLAGTEDGITVAEREASLTDPQLAHEFIEQSRAELLAVSIGNVHGYTPDPPVLDLTRLARIATQVDVPLVLHGASGIPAVDIQQAIRLGIAKLNVNTELRSAFVQALARWGVEVGPNPDLRQKGQDLLAIMQAARSAATNVVAQIILTCGLLDTNIQKPVTGE